MLMLIFNQPITFPLCVLYCSIVQVIKIIFDGMESFKSKFVLYVETVLQKHVCSFLLTSAKIWAVVHSSV